MADDTLIACELIAAFAHITELTAPRSNLAARIHLQIVARAPTRPLGAAPTRCSLRGARLPARAHARTLHFEGRHPRPAHASRDAVRVHVHVRPAPDPGLTERLDDTVDVDDRARR